MIIDERFGWAHLPKTGGTATLQMFQVFPEWSGGHTGRKHSMFAEHEEELTGKLLVANIRRLPDWVLSFAHHRAAQAFRPVGSERSMSSPFEMAEMPRADGWLVNLLGGGRFEVDRWLRMEHLAQDFIDFVSEQRAVEESHRRQIAAIGPIYAHQYDHDLSHWFTPAHIRRMYEQSPRWAAIEREVYGDLVTLD